MSIDEDRIRQIIREELKSLLTSLAGTAERRDGYDTGELERAALYAIKDVTEAEAELLPHGWDCLKRNRSWDNNCSCGVLEPKPEEPPFDEIYRVTEDNLRSVRQWCGGNIHRNLNELPGGVHIRLVVMREDGTAYKAHIYPGSSIARRGNVYYHLKDDQE